MRAEALDRAQHGQSMANYATIFEGFALKGIPETDVLPRVNVFTFNAWKAQGRSVRKGEHGVRVLTYVEMTKRDEDPEKEPNSWRQPRATTVFHISQTDPMEMRGHDEAWNRDWELSGL